MAPGCSYAKFLKAYECSQTKVFFPYEWVNDLNKLDHPQLPPHEAFYSKLKGCNITEDEYAYCQRVWRGEGHKTFRDFVIWYNNLDVEPFLEAVEKMFAFYKQKHIDMFRSAISVPGLSLQHLFLTKPRDVYFSLIDSPNQDLFHNMKDNTVGGPSIIFQRYHKADKTRIRGGKLCKKVVGFDANALYLWSLMQKMPTGTFVRRQESKKFAPLRSHRYGIMATEWLDWEAKSTGVYIQHQFNYKEKTVGSRDVRVDGYCQETHTVYQFQGCFWHGHNCMLNRNEVNSVNHKTREVLMEETLKTSSYIRELGYDLVEMWECEWAGIQKTD